MCPSAFSNQSSQNSFQSAWHTFAHKEAEGSFIAVSKKQIIPDLRKASSLLSYLRMANSNFPLQSPGVRVWSSIAIQILKPLCLSLGQCELLVIMPCLGCHQVSHEKQLSIPLIIGPQTRHRQPNRNQMLFHSLYLPVSIKNKSLRAWKQAEEREVLSIVKASPPQISQPECPAT